MEINFQDNKDRYRFDDTSELLNFLESETLDESRCLASAKSSDAKRSSSWCDTVDFNDALRKAREGDPEVAEKIKPKDIDLSESGRLACISYDTEGDFVDVGKFLSGEPECMGSMRRKGKPIVKILVNFSCNHTITAGTIQKRGKAILEIMSGLEANGYGVDIVLTQRSIDFSEKYSMQTFIKIKDSKEYFNLHQLAFWLVSPSVLRRVGFRLKELLPAKSQNTLGGSYGCPQNLLKEDLDAMPDTVYFPIIQNDWEDFTKAIDQVMDKYKA